MIVYFAMKGAARVDVDSIDVLCAAESEAEAGTGAEVAGATGRAERFPQMRNVPVTLTGSTNSKSLMSARKQTVLPSSWAA